MFVEPDQPCQAEQRVGTPLVVGTSSRLLYEVLAGLFDDLAFGVLADETVRDLVIARVVEPTSILDTPRVVMADLRRRAASEKTCAGTWSGHSNATTATGSARCASTTR